MESKSGWVFPSALIRSPVFKRAFLKSVKGAKKRASATENTEFTEIYKGFSQDSLCSLVTAQPAHSRLSFREIFLALSRISPRGVYPERAFLKSKAKAVYH